MRESQIIVWDETGVHVAESASGASDEAILIRIHKSYAHPGGVFVYRITWHGKSIVYATDTEGYVGTDKRLVKFAKGADVLIHDTQYLDAHYWGQLEGLPSTQGYGHSTVTMATEVAASAEAGRLVLFHHDPSYTDAMLAGMERTAKSLFADSVMAYEGLEIAPSGASTALPMVASLSAKAKEEVKYVQNG